MRRTSRTRPAALLAALSMLVVAACQEISVTTVPVDSLVVEPSNVVIQVDSSARLTARVTSQDGQPLPGRAVDWSSLHPAIASVDGDGNVRGVAPGTATIRASSEGAAAEASVTVTSGPAIAATPLQVEFTAAENGSNPGDRTVSITNGGTGTLNRLARAVRYAAGEPTGWLSAVLPSGTAPTNLVLSANPAGLAPGTYNAAVDISSPVASNSPVAVAVRLVVTGQAPAIGLSPASLSFSATAGGPSPAAQTVSVTNVGGGSLGGLGASIDYGSGPSGWLTATLGGTSAPTTLTVRPTTGSLSAGTYTAVVRVTSGAAQNSPQQVSVTFTVSATTPTAPGAPSALTASAESSSRIRLEWNASSGSVSVYRIQRRLSIGGTYAVVDSVDGGKTDYRDADLLPATGYTYRIQACGPGGCSGFSNEASATTQVLDQPPGLPGDLTAERVSSTQVQVSWTAPGGQTSYDLRRRTGTGGGWDFEQTLPGDATSWLNTGLSPQTTYQYQIRACSAAGCSDYSSPVTVSTSPSGSEGSDGSSG
jgi:hypothetical protein